MSILAWEPVFAPQQSYPTVLPYITIFKKDVYFCVFYRPNTDMVVPSMLKLSVLLVLGVCIFSFSRASPVSSGNNHKTILFKRIVLAMNVVARKKCIQL